MHRRADFPIFANHPDLVYLDSGATTQKPAHVINGIKDFLENGYANVHRGLYKLSKISEELFWQSRQKVAEFIKVKPDEIVFSSNSTRASNLLVQSLIVSDMLQAGDKIVLSPIDHHANIVPWLMGAERAGCQIEWLTLTQDLSLDMEDIAEKCKDARVLALTHVSNVTGENFDVQHIGTLVPEECLYVIDGSQSIPHFAVDVPSLGCDFFWFTGHKLMASTGIGVLRGRKELLDAMTPSIGGGGAIAEVRDDGYSLVGAPDKFEPGTPNLVGTLSLLRAIEYIETIGGTVAIGQIEKEIKSYMNTSLRNMEQAGELKILGPHNIEDRVSLFSLVLPPEKNPHGLGQWMADRDICIRCGSHCAHPLHKHIASGSCRASLYIYNTTSDVDRFLQSLQEFLGVA